MSNPARNEHGVVLLATLGLIFLLLPLAAFVAVQCRTDLMIQHNRRAEIEAFAMAEAGLERALATIPPGTSFDALLAGGDGVAGTADDGVFPFAAGAPALSANTALQYRVAAAAGAESNTVRLISTGSSVNNARVALEAIVGRASQPFTPAALYCEGPVHSVDLGEAGLVISGFDHPRPGGTSAAQGGGAIPALGLSDAGAAEDLRAHVSSAARGRLVGRGDAPSVTHAAAIGVSAYAARLSQRADVTRLHPSDLSDGMAVGSMDVPQLTIVDGDVVVSGTLSGSGVLVVRGDLRIAGTLNYVGLVLVAGELALPATGAIDVRGTIWCGAPASGTLALTGRGAVAYSNDTLVQIDRAFADLFPHGTVVLAWRQQF